MEDQQSIQLFDELTIDEELKGLLLSTGRWARYTGILTIGLAVLGIIGFVYAMIKFASILGCSYYFNSSAGITSMIFIVITALVYISIAVFTLRFSKNIDSGLRQSSQYNCDLAWHNLKLAFR